MAETKKIGLTQVEFEEQRRAMALDILKQTQEFIAWDLEFNKNISNLAELLVKQFKENPNLISNNSNIDEVLKEIQLRKDSGIIGSDVYGSDAWDDIWGVIKEILTGEKDFIKEIIIKILGL